MIDFIKIRITDFITVDNIWISPLLYFKNEVNKMDTETGEILQINCKEYRGAMFKLEPHKPRSANESNKCLIIEFKPHYWHNGNQHNANDFTPYKAISTIKQFINLFGLHDYDKYKIVNLEFGVNFLITGFDKNLVLYPSFHSRNQFLQDRDNQYSRCAHSFNIKGKPNKYLRVKFYSKGFQFPEYCPGETIRFEISTKQSKKIKAFGNYNIGDLLNVEVYNSMKNELIKQAQKVLILDPELSFDNLNKREINKLKEQSNPYYWNKAINQKRPNAFNEKKKIYFKHLNKTGRNITLLLVETIITKIDQLFEKNGKYSTPQFENNER